MSAVASPPTLLGRVAVVAGGGRGIGRAIALALGGAGAAVAVLARSTGELAETVRLIEGAGGRALALPADLTDGAMVRHTFAEIVGALGPVEVLVNATGVIGPIGPFWQSDVDDWWHAIEVLLRSHVLCTRIVLPAMIASRRGRIVNIASGGGAFAIPYLSSYNTAKTALIRFTECVAAEARPYGVTMFAIGPGTVRTAMSEETLRGAAGRRWLPWFLRIFAAGLDVPPERAAQLALVLASGKADALSGRFVRVTDDLEAMLAGVAEIERDKLYSLRIRALRSGAIDPELRDILEAAERPAQVEDPARDRAPGA